MTSTRDMLLAGAAGAFLAGAVAVAVALVPLRQMTVQLPGGGTEEIRYSGTAPEVAIYPNAVSGALRPAAFEGPHFGPPPGFAPAPDFGPPMDPMIRVLWHNIDGFETMVPANGVCIRQIAISSTGAVTSRSLGSCATMQRESNAVQGSTHQHV